MEPRAHEKLETRQAHQRAVERVIDQMRQRLDDDMSLRDMARIAYMSPYHFVRTFRDVTGTRPRQYFRALRLQAAKQMLVETSSSVTDVCFDVGYSSLGTFIRCFTDLLGVSPRRLRLLAHTDRPKLSSDLTPPNGHADDQCLVSGNVIAPDGFDGPVFIGLYPTALPQGVPLACAIGLARERYRVTGVRDGVYHLFAVAVPWSASPRELILCQSALRAGGHQIEVRGGRTSGPTDLELREPSPLDPPLLVTLPALISRRTPLGVHRSRSNERAAAG